MHRGSRVGLAYRDQRHFVRCAPASRGCGANIRADPFERGPESFEYAKWMADRSYLLVPSQVIVGKWLESFKEFPIRQKPASFNLDSVMEKLSPKN